MEHVLEIIFELIFDIAFDGVGKKKDRLGEPKKRPKVMGYILSALIFTLILSGMFIFIYLSLVTIGIIIKIVFSGIAIILGAILISFMKGIMGRKPGGI